MIFGKKKKEREEKNALACQLLSDSRQKKFDDWKNWPDAYVVDQVAVYAAGGQTLLYVDERVEDFDIDHYNLDVIIALAYRVQSPIAVRFRRWATQRLHEYIQKGFTMDDERLKQGGNRYFRELLQRIRDIRSSERNFYQQVTDIYATATDYDPRAKMTKLFFATVQNKTMVSTNRLQLCRA